MFFILFSEEKRNKTKNKKNSSRLEINPLVDADADADDVSCEPTLSLYIFKLIESMGDFDFLLSTDNKWFLFSFLCQTTGNCLACGRTARAWVGCPSSSPEVLLSPELLCLLELMIILT